MLKRHEDVRVCSVKMNDKSVDLWNKYVCFGNLTERGRNMDAYEVRRV